MARSTVLRSSRLCDAPDGKDRPVFGNLDHVDDSAWAWCLDDKAVTDRHRDVFRPGGGSFGEHEVAGLELPGIGGDGAAVVDLGVGGAGAQSCRAA